MHCIRALYMGSSDQTQVILNTGYKNTGSAFTRVDMLLALECMFSKEK